MPKAVPKKIEDIISFTHNYQVLCSELHRDEHPALFSTIFGSCLMNWNISIERPAFIRREQGYRINLQNDGLRDKYPPIHGVEMEMKIVDSVGRDFIKPIKHQFARQDFPEDFLFNIGFNTPEDGEIARQLGYAAELPEYRDKKVVVITIIDFKTKELEKIDNLTSSQARPVPIDLDFRYDVLVDKKFHDLRLRTINDDVFWVSKEAVYVASKWFRDRLTPDTREMLITVQSLEALETTVTYMFTGRYKPPKKMTADISRDIMQLAVLFMVKRISLLRKTVERHCYEELLKNYEDLPFILNYLLSARQSSLHSIQICCISLIVYYHFVDFKRNYAENTPDEFAQLRTRLPTQKSLITIIDNIYAQHQRVTMFRRQIDV